MKPVQWRGPGPLWPVAPWKKIITCLQIVIYPSYIRQCIISELTVKLVWRNIVDDKLSDTQKLHTLTQIHKITHSHIRVCLCISPPPQQGITVPSRPEIPPYRGFTITLRHTTFRRTPWTSDQSDAETSNWQDGIRIGNPRTRTAIDLCFRPRGHWNRLHIYVYIYICILVF